MLTASALVAVARNTGPLPRRGGPIRRTVFGNLPNSLTGHGPECDWTRRTQNADPRPLSRSANLPASKALHTAPNSQKAVLVPELKGYSQVTASCLPPFPHPPSWGLLFHTFLQSLPLASHFPDPDTGVHFIMCYSSPFFSSHFLLQPPPFP